MVALKNNYCLCEIQFNWMPCIFTPVFLFSKFAVNELIKLFLANTFPEIDRG